MMYRCNDCVKTFDEDEIIVNEWQEARPYGTGFVYEPMGECLCPYCKSDDIEEMDNIEEMEC